MKTILVVYRSNYGFTKTYAQWLAEALHADLKDGHNMKPQELSDYDVILFGGGLYAGGVNGISLLVKAFPNLRNKALYLFTVGAANVNDETNVAHIRSELSKVLTQEMQEHIKIFHLRGGIDYPKLSLVHRAMMGMMVKGIRKKPEQELTAEELTMLETYGELVDFTHPSNIIPIVQDVEATLAASSPSSTETAESKAK